MLLKKIAFMKHSVQENFRRSLSSFCLKFHTKPTMSLCCLMKINRSYCICKSKILFARMILSFESLFNELVLMFEHFFKTNSANVSTFFLLTINGVREIFIISANGFSYCSRCSSSPKELSYNLLTCAYFGKCAV